MKPFLYKMFCMPTDRTNRSLEQESSTSRAVHIDHATGFGLPTSEHTQENQESKIHTKRVEDALLEFNAICTEIGSIVENLKKELKNEWFYQTSLIALGNLNKQRGLDEKGYKKASEIAQDDKARGKLAVDFYKKIAIFIEEAKEIKKDIEEKKRSIYIKYKYKRKGEKYYYGFKKMSKKLLVMTI